MTDEQIGEIYSLARESFFGGQKSFQIQAYPFRMTPLNMAKHRTSPHLAFWRMLKQGYDHFEVTRVEPKVDVCDKHYVFNAQSARKFSPAESCPAYTVPKEIVAAVREKQHRDEIATADLISRGTATVPARMGVDGGMNPTFLAAVKSNGGPGATIRTSSGTIPAHVNPPAQSDATGSMFGLASAESRPAQVQVASADSGGIKGFFSNLFGAKPKEQNAQPIAKPGPAVAAPSPSRSGPVNGSNPKPESQAADSKNSRVAAAKPQSPPPRQHADAEPESKPANAAGQFTGAAPTVPAGVFENRFGSWQ
jgi:hypothetical protein